MDTIRQRIVDEALTWKDTPYKHMGKVKGSGCDCITLVLGVYQAVGFALGVELPKDESGREYYSPEWNLHQNEELYLAGLIKHCVPVSRPELGDIVMFKMGRTVAHGGLWLGRDRFIHSWERSFGVTIDEMNDYWLPRYRGAYTLKALVEPRLEAPTGLLVDSVGVF